MEREDKENQGQRERDNIESSTGLLCSKQMRPRSTIKVCLLIIGSRKQTGHGPMRSEEVTEEEGVTGDAAP